MATKKRKKSRRKAPKARRRSYITNPRPAKASKRRRYRRNPSAPILAYIMQALAGLGGAIAAPKLVNLAPVAPLYQNLTLALGGIAAMYFGRKNPLIVAAGLGSTIIGGRNLALNAVPMLAGDYEFTEDEALAIADQSLSDDIELDSPFAGPLGNPMMGSPFAGPLAGPLSSPFNSPMM